MKIFVQICLKYFCQTWAFRAWPKTNSKMRIWCIPKSTSLECPSLPPRIDRDVFIRSPPPPPRLSKQEKLARGVIVYKTRKNKNKSEKAPKPLTQNNSKSASSLKTSKSSKQPRKVRYADLQESEPSIKDSTLRPRSPKPEAVEWTEPVLPPAPCRGEIVHSRQQSNTSGTSSSCLTTSPGSMTTSPQYSSSSGRGSFAEVPASPSPTSNTCDTRSGPCRQWTTFQYRFNLSCVVHFL